LYSIGLAYAGMGDRQKAKESYWQALSFYPLHRSTLNNLGTAYFEEKKYDSAYSYFKRCYDADSLFAKSSQNLAIYYFTVGNYNESVKFASNAVRLNKYQLISYDVLSKAYKSLGNVAEANRYQSLYVQMSVEAREAPEVLNQGAQ